MLPARSTWLRRLAVLLSASALSLVLAACGQHRQINADNEAEYIAAGPLSYQVQISRELNPFAPEDHEYLSGVPTSQLQLAANQEWFAIFLWAKNETHSSHTTTNRFDIVDTEGNRYYPVALNTQANPYAWTAETLRPNETEPLPDTPPFFGPTQGQEILFKLNDNIYDNRPLRLEIYPPGESRPSTVNLDL